MSNVKSPLSLRALRGAALEFLGAQDGVSAKTIGIAAALASSVGVSALAQNASTMLPAVKVDAPVEKPKPIVAPKPKPAPAVVARAKPAPHPHPAPVAAAPAHRVVAAPARIASPSRGPAAPGPRAGAAAPTQIAAPAPAPNANPYADPVAPYKVDRLSSNKFTQPILDTPRTVTTLTKEVLEDKGATSLRELGRSTAGVTLGTGEGGNAFGDRFFIRGFDARNDIFIDGVRDPGVSIRENFYTEQVEILRGPGSTFSGRGTAGGAINIVTKQATDRDFVELKTMGGTSDQTKRITLDVNKAISPVLAVRANGLFHDAGVAGRSFVTDYRDGATGSVVFKPLDTLTFTANYNHVYMKGLPDFGVPYNRIANRPFTENLVPRYTWYGLANRDFTASQQNFGTLTGEWKVNEHLTLASRLRQERSVLDYIGTIAEGANLAKGTVNLNPQSRYQVTTTLASQSDATLKFATGPVKHTAIFGAEFSREGVTRDTYAGLQSELSNGSSSGSIVANLWQPPTVLPFGHNAYLTGNPTRIAVDTKAGYFIETANYNDLVIANAGVRFDDYKITSRDEALTTFAASHSGMVNYNGGLVLKPRPDVSLYAAYATSSNPVGAELDGSAANYGGLNPSAQIFAPQLNRAKEIGAKWELFDRHMLASAALFRTDVSGAREVNGGVTTAQAAYHVQGVDLQIAGNITPRWNVIGGAVFMESKVDRSVATSNVGLQLANVAHQSFSVLSKVEFGDLLGLDKDALEIGGQAVYRSKIYGGGNLIANGGASINAAGLAAPTASNPFVNVPTVLPSYWRFDAFAEAKIGKNVTIKVSVNNIFDRTYYDAFYQSASPFTQIAPGRAAYLETIVKF